jgi:hypothetical protein
VRGEVVLTDVGLDLDDPTDPPASGVVPDQARSEQVRGGLERRSAEEIAELAQPPSP